MNNIQEMDWAEESWHGHTGIDSSCDYCIVNKEGEEGIKEKSETSSEGKAAPKGNKNTVA